MKVALKNMFKSILGTHNITMFKLSISSLVTSCILFIFALLYQGSNNETNIFTYASALFFVLWLITTKGFDNTEKLCYEFVRLIFFFGIFIYSINYFAKCNNYHGLQLYLFFTLSCIGLFLCSYYFISKLSDIFNFIRNLFEQFKSKLFYSKRPETSKLKSFIENITAFLVSVGGFAIAFKTITESIFQILEYFK